MRSLGGRVTVAILETPAGFQPNSALVAQKLADFFSSRLSEFVAGVHVVRARRRDGDASTNDPHILWPLLSASYIFLGPGSPTYTVRHLQGSLAYHTILARHRQGATLCLASAATIAMGRRCLPVYEIFKAGEDPHWQDGLDLLAHYGLKVSFVTHWNNREGGEDLDTSCCFMGRERMDKLLAMLAPDDVVIAIDEHTALVLDLAENQCWVRGIGTVSVIKSGLALFTARPGDAFPIDVLGRVTIPPETHMPVPDAPWPPPPSSPEIQRTTVESLLRERAAARKRQDWAKADALRQQLQALGIEVRDTPQGTLWRASAGEVTWSLFTY